MNAPGTLPALPADTWVPEGVTGGTFAGPSAPTSVWIAVLTTWIGAALTLIQVVGLALMAYVMPALVDAFDAKGSLALGLASTAALCCTATTVAGFLLKGRRWAHRALAALAAVAAVGVMLFPLALVPALSGVVALIALLTPSARAWPRTAR